MKKHSVTRIVRRERRPNRLPLGAVWLAVFAGVALAACDPSPPPGETGTLDVRAPAFTEAGVEGCHECHAGAFDRSIAGTPHGDVSDPSAPYGQHGCESCHGPGSFHVSRAHGGRGVPPLMQFGFGPGSAPRDQQLAACQDCHHPEAEAGAAIAFTGSTHDSRFVNCSTCHTMHAEVEPLSEPSRQADICLECHRSQREEHPEVRGRRVDFAARACSGCHEIHAVAVDEEDIDFGF